MHRKLDLACVLGLVLLVLLLFLPVAFMGEGLYYRDLTFNHLVRKQVSTDLLLEGSPPLWNPHLNLGEPLLANPNNAAAHPSNLLFLVLPRLAALNWAVLLELMLAAISMYLLQRRWRVRPLVALVAASGYLLSGHLLSLGNFWNALAAAAPAPLALLAADLSARSRSSLGPLFLGAVWALQATGGEPVIGLTTALLASGYLLLMSVGETTGARLRHGLLCVATAGAWAFGLSAIQLFPAVELVRDTPRMGGLSVAEGGAWSLHPATLLEAVAPGLFGNPTLSSPHYWGGEYQHRGMPYILAIGLGKVTLLMAAIAGLFPDRRTRVLLGAAAISLVFALGVHTPLFGLAFEHLPFFSLFRFPIKFFFITTLCLCALSGPGLERLIERRDWTRRRQAIAGAFVGLLFLALVAGKFVAHPPEPGALLGPLGIAGLAILGTLGLSALLARRSVNSGRLLLLLAVLQLVELFPVHSRLNPSAPHEVLNAGTEATRFLSGDRDLFRIHRRPPPARLQLPTESTETPLARNLLDRRMLTPNYGIYFGLSYGLNRTSDALEPPATAMLGAFAESLPPEGRARIHGLANIKYVLDFAGASVPGLEPVAEQRLDSNPPLRVSLNRHVMPRAYVVGETRRVDDLREACIALGDPDFDPRRTAIVSGSDPAPGSGAGFSPAIVSRYGAQQVVVDVVLEAPGTLVLLDTHAPGWRATVDGAPAEIQRANVAFRGVAVDAGAHRVEFTYRPRSFLIGALLSGLTLLAGLALIAARLRRPAVSAQRTLRPPE